MPRVILTGVTTFPGARHVLLKVQFPANPPEPAREQSYILSEGERSGEIEVLEIDDKATWASISIAGTVKVLTFEQDGPKLPNLSPPPPLPPSPIQPVWSQSRPNKT